MRPRLALVGLLLASCLQSTPVPSPTAALATLSPVSTPAPSPQRVRTLGLGNGLVVDAPTSWTWIGDGIVNRATQRLLLLGNGDLAALPRLPGNGDIDAAALPAGQVTVEVEEFCRLSCAGPASETALPLDWSAATPLFPALPLPQDRHQVAVAFRWFAQPLFLVARWADDAPSADIAAIAQIARSLRPDPVPGPTGEYRGWDGLGPLAGIGVGTVQLTPLPAGAVIRPPLRTTDNVPFFVVRGKINVYAFASRPLADQRCEISYDRGLDRFVCDVDGRRYEWSRFGRYLGPEPSSDLPQHDVIVRDGIVWVRYTEAGRYLPSVPDEAAER
ncbi:MAG: hypothetical protein E6I51_04840 [Chloroflexi bacterium]|nr:MAG: hypothetical protein E6I51_04840 [Chloroflexota bacterium]